MRERIPPSVGHLSALDATRCVLETGAQRPDMLGYHLAMLGVDFTVIEPETLREHLRALARRLRRAGRGPEDALPAGAIRRRRLA